MLNSAIASAACDGRSEVAFGRMADGDEPATEVARGASQSEADCALLVPVREALNSTGYFALRQVEIEIVRGTVILWGRVSSYHLKQLAQWSVQQVTGVRGVGNGLEVVCSRSRAP